MKYRTSLILAIVLLFAYTVNLYAQFKFVRTDESTGKKYFAGSLPKDASGKYHKLRIEIFGGGYSNTTLGTNTYSISNRGGLKINQEIRGGDTGQYTLKVYKNQDEGYDFVIESLWAYSALFIQSWLSPNNNVNTITSLTSVNITEYDPGSNEDITNQVSVNCIYASTSDGKIGIGTKNPTARLDVNGTIRSKEIKIEATGWSDFVFGEDYKLPALSEVESHIKEHKHLPDVPSEKQVIEEGVNVAEMQAKLLQKIEELTLYVIEQDKKILKQDKKIKQLEEKLTKE